MGLWVDVNPLSAETSLVVRDMNWILEPSDSMERGREFFSFVWRDGTVATMRVLFTAKCRHLKALYAELALTIMQVS